MEAKYVHRPAVTPEQPKAIPTADPPAYEKHDSFLEVVQRNAEEQIRARPMAAVVAGFVLGLVAGILLRR